MMHLFIKGVGLGFAIAAPVGPIGLLCIQRTLAQGQRVGFLSGLGAATADGLYGAVAAFGLVWVSQLLTHYVSALTIGGGIFLCYLGITTMITPIPNAVPQPGKGGSDFSPGLAADAGLGSDLRPDLTPDLTPDLRPNLNTAVGVYLSTFILTLANPATILSFVLIFAGYAPKGLSYSGATILVLGVFTGSAGWWLLLSAAVSRLRRQLTPQRLKILNVCFGLLIIGFGIIALSLKG